MDVRKIIDNPTAHYRPESHPEIMDEWIERTLTAPHHQETGTDGRELYYGVVPEEGKWIRVVVENDRLHTAYFDKRLIMRWGMP